MEDNEHVCIEGVRTRILCREYQAKDRGDCCEYVGRPPMSQRVSDPAAWAKYMVLQEILWRILCRQPEEWPDFLETVALGSGATILDSDQSCLRLVLGAKECWPLPPRRTRPLVTLGVRGRWPVKGVMQWHLFSPGLFSVELRDVILARKNTPPGRTPVVLAPCWWTIAAREEAEGDVTLVNGLGLARLIRDEGISFPTRYVPPSESMTGGVTRRKRE